MLNILAETGTNSFFIDLLEKGGLPALALGICFTIFMFWIKMQAKKDTNLQSEREIVRGREAKQYEELMKAYEEMVRLLFDLSKETTQAITRLSERIAQCPTRALRTSVIHEEITDDE